MKKVLALILSIAMLASLCVTAMADDTITLNFQMWSDEEELFTELIRLYEAEHPNVKINMTCTPSSDYTVKLQTVLGGGGDVDMFGISSPPGLAEYVNKGAVRPLDDLIAAAGTDLSGVQSILGSIAIDGKTYGLPYKTSSWFVVYNKDIFDAAGVPYPTGAWTWEEYAEIAAKLTSGEGADKIYGSLNFQPTSMWWRVPGNSMGATNPLNDDELHAWMRAAEFCKSLSDAGSQPLYEDMAGDAGADYAGNFLQGKYGMFYNGDWVIEMLNTAIRNGDGNVNYDIAPLPHWEGEQAVTPGAAAVLMVTESSKNAEAAYDFIAFCTGAEASKTLLAMDYFPAWQDDNTVATYCEGKTAPEHIEFVVNQDIISQVPCDALYNPATNVIKEEVSLYLLGEQDIETTEENCKARIQDEVVNAQ
ncbi:MAG: sugar ABC transporter substrate-binding protein [Eubacteriales bacterium]|nr:sugar ABC transporter substrate-binding protein [Eubacteriales bacterium]